jgi:hypothetical protein
MRSGWPIEGRIGSRKRRKTMKIVHKIQHPTFLRLLVGVLIATCAFTAAADAYPRVAAKFTLPHEVRWGQAVLPAGEYFIRMDSMATMPVISSVSGNRTVFTEPPTIADSEKGCTCITITVQGNERRVRSLNLPALGKSVIFVPLTKTEREILAKGGQITTVPLVSAKK